MQSNDPLIEADARAAKLAAYKDEYRFKHLTFGDRAMMTVFMDRLEALERRIVSLERK